MTKQILGYLVHFHVHHSFVNLCLEFRGIPRLIRFRTFWTPKFSSEFYSSNCKMCSHQFWTQFLRFGILSRHRFFWFHESEKRKNLQNPTHKEIVFCYVSRICAYFILPYVVLYFIFSRRFLVIIVSHRAHEDANLICLNFVSCHVHNGTTVYTGV